MAIAAMAILGPIAPTLSAQDTLVLANGQRRDGQILGVADGKVRFKSGPAEASLPLEQVVSARMEAPAAFQKALDALQAGDVKAALATLGPLVQSFRGLPAPWIERASAMLGGVLLDNGDTAAAEAAFSAFQKAYPKATGLADLGLARLAVEKKDFDGAAARIEPIVAKARKTLLAESVTSAEYGQALYLMGNILEERGLYSEALDSYLLASTVFFEDASIAAKAQTRAEALATDKKATVP
jgi:tetratricopeptide (TPR) repeat protein